MKKLKHFSTVVTLTFLLFAQFSFAQSSEIVNTKIKTVLSNYFLLERENIHLHLDKEVFITNEAVWFKGYVFNQKKELPFFTTTNLYAVLRNQEGKVVSQKLFFANNGSFSGSFQLDASYPTGNYYIQLYTNWMNNFSEDESSVFKIKIINQDDSAAKLNSDINYASATIDLYPEGGKLLKNASNLIGISISDCNKNPVQVKEVALINSQNQVVKTIPINKFGNGKFDIVPTGESYKISADINGSKIETKLPDVVQEGIAIEINNYALTNKTIAKIRTNAQSIKNFVNNTLYFVVQQNERFSSFEVKFDEGTLEKEMIFPNDYLFDGVNTVRILDGDLKQWCERLIFKYPATKTDINIVAGKSKNGIITLKGTSNLLHSNVSISVLPENSIAHFYNNSLKSSFLLNNYLNQKINNAGYYVDQPSKLKHLELDLMLLNQKTNKYQWTDIVNNPPKQAFDFDMGLTLKGTLNQTYSDYKKYRIQLFSLKSWLNETTTINEKNEFYFKNLVLSDSSWVNFTLLKMPDKTPMTTNLYTKMVNNKVTFHKPYVPTPLCETKLETTDTTAFLMPKFTEKVIMLEDVEIKSNKPQLKYKNKFGNVNLKGYKIEAENNGMTVLNFIQNNGFDVDQYSPDVKIFGRSRTTINGQRTTPVIYIDGFMLMTFQELWGMHMEDIDEIYINAQAIVPSVNNNIGVIKIYRKRGVSGGKDYQSKAESFLITGGFEKVMNFVNSSYISTSDKGFENFGIIDWAPNLLIDMKGEFDFEVPDTQIKSIKLLIEGITPEGNLISEIKTITLD